MNRAIQSSLLLALLAGLPFAAAQESPPGAAAPQAARPAAPGKSFEMPDLTTFSSTGMTRVALIDVLSRGKPSEGDMKIASTLLSFAEDLTPDDPQIVRWRVQLANSGNDKETLERELRRLLELDPKDTTLQLKLIKTRLEKIQVADDRIVAYERFLSNAGSQLDVSVRSQLALELAILYHDRGDREKCAEKIKLATGLDSTNKDAAAFALTFYTERLDDPMGRLELLANLLYADPIDTATLTEISHELAGGGAFKEARRFQKLSDNIRSRAGQQQDTTRLMEDLALAWCSDGPATVVDRMNTAKAVRVAQAKNIIEQYTIAELPTVGLQNPDDVRLDPTLDRIRLIAARAAEDTVTADLAAAELRASYDEAILTLVQPASGVVQNPEQVPGIVASLQVEIAIVLGWCDAQTERVTTELDALVQLPGFDTTNPAYLEARAWNTLRTGDAPKAIELFAPLADESLTAKIGLATAYEKTGRTDDALSLLRSICRQEPLSLEACWAATHVTELTNVADFDPELATRMRKFAAGIPSWLEEMSTNPGSFMDFSAEILNKSPGPLERVMMRVRLTNRAQVPLSLGPGHTLDSRVMLSPSMLLRSETVRNGLLPDILDIGRRMRLMPRESVEVLFWPEAGGIGWLAETHLREAVRVRWRLLQGFIRGLRGGMEQGPMALSAGTEAVVRPPLAEALLTPAELANRFQTAPDTDLPALITAVRAQLLAQKTTSIKNSGTTATPEQIAPNFNPFDFATDNPVFSKEDREVLAAAALERFARSNARARAIFLSGLPTSEKITELNALDQLAATETDPACQALYLITRVSKLDDPALAAAAKSADPRVVDIARLHTERLAQPRQAAPPGQQPAPIVPTPQVPSTNDASTTTEPATPPVTPPTEIPAGTPR